MSKKGAGVSLDSLELDNQGILEPGSKVQHPLFGKGIVLEIFKFESGEITINIEFGPNDTKWLVPEYANLALLGDEDIGNIVTQSEASISNDKSHNNLLQRIKKSFAFLSR